jgi:hypothetical protein
MVGPQPFSHFASKRQSMQRTTHDFLSIWFALGWEATRLISNNRTVLETLATRAKQPVVRMAEARCNGAGIGTISFFARRIHDQSIVKPLMLPRLGSQTLARPNTKKPIRTGIEMMDAAKPILTKQLASLFGFEDGLEDILEMLLTIEGKQVGFPLLMIDGIELVRSFPCSHSLIRMTHHDLPGPEDLPGAVTWQRQRHAIIY